MSLTKLGCWGSIIVRCLPAEVSTVLGWVSEPIVSRVPSGGSESPSWIHMARQKQRVFKENSVEEAQERNIEKVATQGFVFVYK